MKKAGWISCIALLAVVLLAYTGKESPARRQAGRPNIVIFLADDLGYYDTEPYGNKVVKTPHLNTLARGALKFTNALDRKSVV